MKFVINVDKLLKELAPSEYFGIMQGNQVTTYRAMVKCVTDDNGNALEPLEARRAIDTMSNNSMADFERVQAEFTKALIDALVNPTSGNG
jgi:hypothetical protein